MALTDYEKLKVVMTEYEILRREVMERVKLQIQLYPLALTAISLIFGYLILNEKYDALLLLPLVTILLAYRWIWEVRLVEAGRRYLLKLEREVIPGLMSSDAEKEKKQVSKPKSVGWQRYYEQWRSKQPRMEKYGWFISIALLLGVPTLISILYYLQVLGGFDLIFHVLRVDPHILPPIKKLLYGLATVSYLVLSGGVVVMVWRSYRERESQAGNPSCNISREV